MINILRQRILARIFGVSIVISQSFGVMGAGDVVFDPTTYASILESIEKYNTMIKNLQDSLDTLNRINDVMNSAESTLNNLQVGLANPKQLAQRFQSNLQGIQNNFNRITENLQEREWKDSLIQEQYASCKTKWQNLRKDHPEAYEKSKVAPEIEANMKWLDSVNNEGLFKANEQIHSFFDGVMDKTNILDIEAKIAKKNPKETMWSICKLVEKQRLEINKKTCQQEYYEAINNKDLEKAKEKKECVRLAENQLKGLEFEEMEKRLDIIKKNANILKLHSTEEPILVADTENCNFDGKKWEKYKKTSDVDIFERRTIDNKTYCWLKQEVIHEIFDAGDTNEAISLQNQRNKALALANDTHSLAQGQLETLEMISKQILALHTSLNAMAYVSVTQLEQEVEHKKKEQEAYNNLNRNDEYSEFFQSIQGKTPSFIYNQYGMPVKATETASVIGGSGDDSDDK